MSIDSPVAMSPALEAYYRDVLIVAEAILDDSDLVAGIRAEFDSPMLDIDAVDFRLHVSGASVDGARTALDIVRLSTDAATIALHRLLDRDIHSLEDVERVLQDSPDELVLIDAGISSFWARLTKKLLSRETREAAGPYVLLAVAAVGVVAALVGSPIVLAAVAAGLPAIDSLWELAVRAGERRQARLASLDAAAALPTELEVVAEPFFTVTAVAWGGTSDLLRLRDRLRSSVGRIRSVDVAPADEPGDALLIIERSESLDWSDVRAIAADYLVTLGDPRVALSGGRGG